MALVDSQIANIVFNETRSLSGAQITDARVNVAHAIMNANVNGSMPVMASKMARVPRVELSAFSSCVAAVQTARNNVKEGTDPTSGATNFNFRKNASRADFFGLKLMTSVGPLDNSYQTEELPKSGIYANTYKAE